MLNSSGGIKPFDTSSAFKGHIESKRRFFLSIAVLNIMPFSFFGYFLGEMYLLDLNIYSLFLVLSLSLSVFGFAKIYYSIVVAGKTKFYYTGELKRLIEQKPDQTLGFGRHYSQQLYPGLLYVIIPIQSFFILTGDVITKILAISIIAFFSIITIIASRVFRDLLKDWLVTFRNEIPIITPVTRILSKANLSHF